MVRAVVAVAAAASHTSREKRREGSESGRLVSSPVNEQIRCDPLNDRRSLGAQMDERERTCVCLCVCVQRRTQEMRENEHCWSVLLAATVEAANELLIRSASLSASLPLS